MRSKQVSKWPVGRVEDAKRRCKVRDLVIVGVPRGWGRGAKAKEERNGYHGQLRPIVAQRGSHGDADGGRTLPAIRIPEAP